MRRLLFVVGLLAACGGDGNHPCTIDCILGPTITVRFVDDATGAPLAIPIAQTTISSTAQPQSLNASCRPNATATNCDTIALTALGQQTITVTVPGFQPASFSADVQLAHDGCCPTVANPLDTTLRLQSR